MNLAQFIVETIATSNGYYFQIVNNKTGDIYATCYTKDVAEVCCKAMNKAF